MDEHGESQAGDALLRAFGRQLRSRRKQAGLTQEQLAVAAGMKQTYVGRVERGIQNVSIRSLARLGEALHLSIAELLEGVGPPSRAP